MDTDSDKKNVGLLSKKLLEGWTLLRDECPNSNCKISLVTKDGKIFCVSCQNYFRKDASGLVWFVRPEDSVSSPNIPIRDLPKSLPLPPSAIPDSRNPISTSNGRLEFSSNPEPPPQINGKRDGKKVAQKLLEGWNLTNRLCSRCSGNLVTDKQNRVFCVFCNSFEGNANNSGYVSNQFPRTSNQFSSPLSNGRNSDIFNGKESFQGRIEPFHGMENSIPLMFEKDPQSILEGTLQSLYDKMESARELLDKTHSISESTKLVTLIESCAKTIKEIRGISSQQ